MVISPTQDTRGGADLARAARVTRVIIDKVLALIKLDFSLIPCLDVIQRHYIKLGV